VELLLVRHASTDSKEKGLILGHIDEGLNENGRQEAEKLALRLKKQKIDAIYSSDLKRAKQTAEIINKYHHMKIKTSKKLRELDFGSFSGKPKKSLQENFRNNDFNVKKHGGIESAIDVRHRASNFLEGVIRKNKNKTVLVISHGITINEIFLYLTKSPDSEWKKFRHDKTGLSILEINPGKRVKIKFINCTKHLG